MMGGHLGEDVMLSVLEGSAGAEESGHAAACAHCRARLEQARAGLELAIGADVPDPGPFYWQSFRRAVDARIQEGEAGPRWRRLAVSPWLAAAAAVIVGVAVLIPATAPRTPDVPAAGGAAAVLPAWSALPPADEDPGLEMLAAVVPTGDESLLAGCQGLGQCLGEVAALSDEDSQALEDALQRDFDGDKDKGASL